MRPVSVYQHNEVVTSDRVKLIIMLYEGAINFLEIARERMALKDIPGKALYLDKVTAIITELQCSLDTNAGGDIAKNLDRLYNFMIRQVSEANINNNTRPIDVTIKLLEDIKSGWEEVGRRSSIPAAAHIVDVKEAAASLGT